jgi:hypothetical protein
MNWITYPHKTRTFDHFDTHLAVRIEINTRNGLLTSVIPTAALIGNFHRPGTLTGYAAEKFGGDLQFRGGLAALYFANSDAGAAARQFIEAAAAPRHRHPANHHQSGGRA